MLRPTLFAPCCEVSTAENNYFNSILNLIFKAKAQQINMLRWFPLLQGRSL